MLLFNLLIKIFKFTTLIVIIAAQKANEAIAIQKANEAAGKCPIGNTFLVTAGLINFQFEKLF